MEYRRKGCGKLSEKAAASKRKKRVLIAFAGIILAAVIVLAAVLGVRLYYRASDKPVSVGLSQSVNDFIMPVKLIAHRGFSGLAPENTIPAVKAAADADFDGCEFDIRLTKDGRWVVFHDNDVSRMTNGEGLVSDMTLAQVQSLVIDAGSNVQQYPDERIPTLEEMLKACADYGVAPVVEIHLEEGQTPDYDAVASALRAVQFGDCMVISADLDALAQMQKLLPDADTRFLSSRVTGDQIERCAEQGFHGISFDASVSANLLHIEKISESGMIIGAWTVDNIHLLDKLYEKGVFEITTNMIYPS